MEARDRTIVIKIGSSLLVSDETGKLRMDFLYHLMNDVVSLRARNFQVVLVSSGSVALGRRYGARTPEESLTLPQKQAAAALGQPALMAAYQNFASEHDMRIAQILITRSDFDDRKRFVNAEDTLEELLKQGIVPIVNENDTVATKHLRVGDNDRLAAKVCHLVEADDLVILTNVGGLLDKEGRIVERVDHLDESVFSLAGGASGAGTGGMITKLQAAEIALASGCRTHITSGSCVNPVVDAIDGSRVHTIIESDITPESARHLWIATSLDIRGFLEVRQKSLSGLREGRSLFPEDLLKVTGEFDRGDIVSISVGDQEVARGIVAFNHHEAQALLERRSPDIFSVLGYRTRPDVVHKNDFAFV
ncbi:glutamate 5-kinase [Pelagicoccus sp. SDUM812002]|uniref:glutamate 5-kinase n=1 Tax=Pelagicoccus sp. SDUM812002 TaxID=3041266 RepID=UPI00280F994D|nr:glutamate 5-kinase [Pelagicoccus sp. SDUM812002]MDQ8185289.1 glutamate 5-kinase [Pelagicoccus sp. SDUM812002]